MLVCMPILLWCSCKENKSYEAIFNNPILYSKTVQNSERFIIKKMVAGKILISEIKGGSGNAEAGIKILESYMDDYHLTSPAISFQSLVTDRQKEKDSSKWVTKIYYPIM